MGGPLTYGNAAKLYCLGWIEDLARTGAELTVVDLGCGDGGDFVELLRRHASLRYVGVEPSAGACAAARRRLAGLNAEIVNAPAYDVSVGPAEVVTSFSVLEHVYRRAAYLACIAANLAPGGHALVNFDAGHFVSPGLRDRVKTLVGGVPARLGRERWYQRRVRDGELRSLVEHAGLEIVEAKLFNTGLKEVYKVVPPAARDRFMSEWLRIELALNELDIGYREELAPIFRTRNIVLAGAG